MMQRAALAVAEDVGEAENAFLARGQQFLGREFGRRMKIEARGAALRPDKPGSESRDMRLVAGRNLQDRGIDLDKAARA